jgi:uncharacterized protein (TIGR01777 family)
MKVLITGATGLVGSALVEMCHERGYLVNYLTTRKEKITKEANYHGFYWNPKKQNIDLKCFDGVDWIINLAGASISKRWTPQYKKAILASRVDSLRTLKYGLQQVEHKVSSFISASAIGIYPNSLERLYEEDEPEVDKSFLGEVVSLWEREADTLKGMGFPVAKVRIGLVMSKKGGALPEMAKPIKYYVGAAFGHGEQWQSWIHIKDLARIFLFIAENSLEGAYNGVGPNPVTNNKLVKEIARVLERPLVLPNIPKFVMKLILGNMSYILFASQRVSSKKIEEEGFLFDYVNICAALRAIYEIPKSSQSAKSNFQKEYS